MGMRLEDKNNWLADYFLGREHWPLKFLALIVDFLVMAFWGMIFFASLDWLCKMVADAWLAPLLVAVITWTYFRITRAWRYSVKQKAKEQR